MFFSQLDWLSSLGRNWLEQARFDRREPLFKRSDGAPKIVPASCQRPGEDRILSVRSIENPRALLFSCNVAGEDLDDAVKIGNQCTDLRRFPRFNLALNLKMVLTFHRVCAQMIRFGTR